MLRRIALAVFLCLVLIATASARGGDSRRVHVYIAVPTTYASTVTPQQADTFVHAALGSSSDAPCIGSTSCSVNGWFRHELGQVFEYTVQTVPMTWGVGPDDPVDACGSTDGPGWFYRPGADLEAAGASFTKNDRTMVLLMGGGGWAGHFAPTDDVPTHQGMVGDWGVMEFFNSRNSCIPGWDYPFRGFSHEFAGMMGEYVTAGYNEGGLFTGDLMSANEKRDLLRYGGRWLRSP